MEYLIYVETLLAWDYFFPPYILSLTSAAEVHQIARDWSHSDTH